MQQSTDEGVWLFVERVENGVLKQVYEFFTTEQYAELLKRSKHEDDNYRCDKVRKV